MRGRRASAVASWVTPCLALASSTLATRAYAGDVFDELTVGALSSNRAPAPAPYVSDRAGGSADATETLNLALEGTYTRYLAGKHVPAENIVQVAAAADFAPNDHFAFGVDARGSPASTTVTRTPTETIKSRTSLLGAGLSVEYDTAGDGPFETIADGAFSVAAYRTTQRALSLAKPSPSVLTQYRASAGLTEVLWDDTEAELSGAYYLYSTDPLGTGYFGTSVFGRGAVSDGLPLEPLRWSLRPTVRQRLGIVKLSLFVQYGRYVGDAGYAVTTGLKGQVKVSDDVRLWASLDFQRDVESTGETLSIPWGSVGVRVLL